MQCCPKSFKKGLESLGHHYIRFQLCKVVPRLLRQSYTGFFLMQCCLIAQDFFLCNVVWGLLDNIAQGFYLCNVVPRVLRQHCIGFIYMQSCLEPFGQHCIGFSAVQCCSTSIKTNLNRIFSYAMLSEASWTTWYKVLTCAMLFQEH